MDNNKFLTTVENFEVENKEKNIIACPLGITGAVASGVAIFVTGPIGLIVLGCGIFTSCSSIGCRAVYYFKNKESNLNKKSLDFE